MMKSEGERIQYNNVQQRSYYWSKCCLETSSGLHQGFIKTSLEGREGRAVTENEWKRIPDLYSRRHGHCAVFF